MLHYNKSSQTGQFEATLCGCCNDCSSCCYAYWCFPCATGSAWAQSRGEQCQCCHMCVVSNMWTRENLKHARGMDNNICQSCCQTMWCPCCTLSQNLREIKLIQSESQAD